MTGDSESPQGRSAVLVFWSLGKLGFLEAQTRRPQMTGIALPQLGRLSQKTRGGQNCGPQGGSGRCLKLPEAPRPWVVPALPWPLLRPQVALSPWSLSSSLLIRTPGTGMTSRIRSLTHPQRPCFQIKSHPEAPSRHELGGTLFGSLSRTPRGFGGQAGSDATWVFTEPPRLRRGLATARPVGADVGSAWPLDQP